MRKYLDLLLAAANAGLGSQVASFLAGEIKQLDPDEQAVVKSLLSGVVAAL